MKSKQIANWLLYGDPAGFGPQDARDAARQDSGPETCPTCGGLGIVTDSEEADVCACQDAWTEDDAADWANDEDRDGALCD